MGNAETLACAVHISAEMLSAWRDDLLPAEEMRRLAEHAAGCAACQARLAQFDEVARILRRQPELEPGERIVAGVRRQAAEPRGRLAWWPRGRDWSSARVLAPVTAVAAVLLLFVYVLGMGSGAWRGPGATATATLAKAPSPSVSVTATMPPLSPSATVQQAWGANAAQATLTTRLDATHAFMAQGLTPDGTRLLGYTYALTSAGTVAESVPAQAGMFDVATKAFTPIHLAAPAAYPPAVLQSDGRYVVAMTADSPQEAGAALHTRYWAYDMVTHQLQVVVIGMQFHSITNALLSHGLLVMGTAEGIQVADLGARTIKPLPGTATQTLVMAYTWPYVVDGSSQLHDLATGQAVTLPPLPPAPITPTGWGMGISGDTVFYSERSSQLTMLYELDHPLVSGSRWRLVGAFGADLGNIVGANARVVAFQAAVWDRAEGQFVTFGITRDATPGSGAALAGDYVALFQPLGTGGTPGGQRAEVYDTARLPVVAAHS